MIQKGSEEVDSNKFKPFLRKFVFLAFFIACIGILCGQIYKSPNAEHKCKATKSKPPESYSYRHPPDTEVPLPPSPSILHVFHKAAVCSDSEVCSNIGRYILQRGGNAVDSALATLACNGLVTMQSMGIGGGFIMNVFQKAENNSFAIIARETAPSDIELSEFSNQSQYSNLQGPISIAVPGEVMGYHVAHKRFGSLPWLEILKPTIDVCEKGFQLSKHQWDSLFFNPRIRDDAQLSEMFVNKMTGEYKRVGSLIHPPAALCKTYRVLANKGPLDFYKGSLARLIVKDLKDIGSKVSLKDLEDYRAEVVETIKMNIRQDTLHLVPPVGGGAIVGLIMNILKGYDFTEKVPEETLIHRIVEALKFGFAKRWAMGDPRFNALEAVLRNISSSQWGEDLRQKINEGATHKDPQHYGGVFAPVQEHGTGHISVLAENGDAVSVTSSIHYYFGSAYMGKRTGIIFNSAMGDFSIPGLPNYFSLPLSEANLLQPHKRPMSSMAPTIVTDPDGNVKLVVGGAGGPKIISALVNILIRVLWMKEDIKQAIDAPRFHHQLEPDSFEYEYGILKQTIDVLEKKGHRTLRYRERGSAFCGIMKNTTAVYANVDFRKLGGVAGF